MMSLKIALRNFGKIAKVPALALTLACGSLNAPAEAARYQPLQFGSWKGGVYVSDKTGDFSHCVVSARYKSGITLLFSVTRNLKWNLGFSKPSWQLEQGKEYPVLYQVDKNRSLSGKAWASNTKLAIIHLPGSTDLFNQMRRGRILRVKAGNDILAFNLTGTSRMLRSLLDCARQNRDLRVAPAVSAQGSTKGSDPDNPFATAQQPKPAPAQPQDRRARIAQEQYAEAGNWFRVHLADYKDQYRVVPNSGSASKMYEKHALIWQVGATTDIVGTLRIFPLKSEETLESNVLAYEARLCKGDFASKFFKNSGLGNVRSNSLLATCRQEGKRTWNTYYIVTSRKEGGSYLVTLLSTKASTEAVAEAGDQLVTNLQTVGGPAPVQQPQGGDLLPRTDQPADTKEF